MDWLFLSHFWPLLKQVVFFEAAGPVENIGLAKGKKPPQPSYVSPNPWYTKGVFKDPCLRKPKITLVKADIGLNSVIKCWKCVFSPSILKDFYQSKPI